ncbi:MAG: hypothetical protein ACR2FV_02915 [Ornithinimicrobium sp.]|uniref:hypothetical protein n=1 Tax=Ornithinimicrobium sp. TaxID=1977084 RepID=UPI003D9BFC45
MSPRRHVVDLRPLRSGTAYRGLWARTSLSGLGMQLTTVAVLYQVWELTGSRSGPERSGSPTASR